jgi:hypothetical protein
MPINQETLNKATREAIRSFCSLLPTMTGPVVETPRKDGIDFVISNPWRLDQSLTVSTCGEELTIYFAQSHYHIADYDRGQTEAELVKDMILGIEDIVVGNSRAYAAYSKNRMIGGGFTKDTSDENLAAGLWKHAVRFEISGWSGPDNT